MADDKIQRYFFDVCPVEIENGFLTISGNYYFNRDILRELSPEAFQIFLVEFDLETKNEQEQRDILQEQLVLFIDSEVVNVGSEKISIFEILKKLNPGEYERLCIELEEDEARRQVSELKMEKANELSVLVLNDFPTSISYHYHRYLYSKLSPNERYLILKDVCESLIFTVTGIVISEFIGLKARKALKQHSFEKVLSWKLEEKLKVTRSLLENEEIIFKDTISKKLFNTQLISELSSLNKIRNSTLHSQTTSDSEIKKIIDECGIVLERVFTNLTGLRDVTLLSRAGSNESGTEMGFYKFKGFFWNKIIELKRTSDLSDTLNLQGEDKVFLVFENQVVDLTPFFLAKELTDIDEKRIAVFKKVKDNSFHYEVIGKYSREGKYSQPMTDHNLFINKLKRLVKDSNAK